MNIILRSTLGSQFPRISVLLNGRLSVYAACSGSTRSASGSLYSTQQTASCAYDDRVQLTQPEAHLPARLAFAERRTMRKKLLTLSRAGVRFSKYRLCRGLGLELQHYHDKPDKQHHKYYDSDNQQISLNHCLVPRAASAASLK